MAGPYDRYDAPRSRRAGWTHWVPLAVTVTVATLGVAAYLISQMRDDEPEHTQEPDSPEPPVPDMDYENAGYGDNPAYGVSSRDDPSAAARQISDNDSQGPSEWGSRVSRVLRRTPSPGTLLDSAGRKVAAGVAAAGAMMGHALAAIREDERDVSGNYGGGTVAGGAGDAAPVFTDIATWPKETRKRAEEAAGPGPGGRKRRTVAVVVSTEGTEADAVAEGGFLEHASLLSHIPRQNDFSRVKIFVLVYVPGLRECSPGSGSRTAEDIATSNPHHPPRSTDSSYSNLGYDAPDTPGTDTKSTTNPESAAYAVVRNQALALVEDEIMVLPFTTPDGHVRMLRLLQPEVDVLYLQESLAGVDGSAVQQIQTWFRHDVVVVVGAETGHGGLADSDSEGESESAKGKGRAETKWWQKTERVGRGRGVVVVDGMRVADDWEKRVKGRE